MGPFGDASMPGQRRSNHQRNMNDDSETDARMVDISGPVCLRLERAIPKTAMARIVFWIPF
jgi:hypothetical protein